MMPDWGTEHFIEKGAVETDLDAAFRLGGSRNFDELQKTHFYLARAREQIEEWQGQIAELETAAKEAQDA